LSELNDKKRNINDKKNNKILDSQGIFHESVLFGILLAIVGGFLDAYTYVGRDGVFANAQTGNIVLLGVYAAKGAWGQALFHIPPILAFVLGVIVTQAIKTKASHFFTLDWKRIVLMMEILVLVVVGFIPQTYPSIIVNVAISFVASVQVSSFSKLVDSPYATTMCTGNLRSASQAAYQAVTQKDRRSAVIAIRYFMIILFFVLGAVLGGLLTWKLEAKAVWGCVLILIIVVFLLIISDRNIGTNESDTAGI